MRTSSPGSGSGAIRKLYAGRTGPSPPTGAGQGRIDTPDVEIDVHVRVYRANSETGNAASESYRRWLHLVAENWSNVPVKDARVSFRVQGRNYGGGWQDWYWT